MIYDISCTKIDNFLSIPDSSYIPCKTAFFHCISTGHYWRNSTITELSILYQLKDETWQKESWQLETESDEYDMLESFSRSLIPFSALIGFNSTSFHIPYLEQKFKAYEIDSPFPSKTHIDLLKEIKAIGKQLHISTKLNDLRIFLNLPDTMTEIECIVSSVLLFQYRDILSGKFFVRKIESMDGELLFYCKTELPFPSDIRIHNEEFYLIGKDDDLKIKVKFYDNKLKLYYPNYKDYYYLPEEDMVLHKSLASAVSKEKREKATYQNCYGYIEYTESFKENLPAAKKYLVSLLTHYTDEKT